MPLKRKNVVIVGRASCNFLKDFDDCYRVRALAPMEWRSKYALEKLGIPAKKVKNIIAERDKMQKWFLRMICGPDIDDRCLFHMSLNMGIDSFSRAAEAIMAVAGMSNPRNHAHPLFTRLGSSFLRTKNKYYDHYVGTVTIFQWDARIASPVGQK